ncbi:MAG: DUF2065 domain-containing protein [Thermodesulfobacteriota bacterium]
MKFLLSLIGVFLILEALPYVASPEIMQKWLKQLSETEPSLLRVIGLFFMAAGLLICYVARCTGLF